MIRVIRIDGTELMLNPDAIRLVEKDENTIITLVTGEKILVKNPPLDIQVKVYAHRIGKEEEQRQKDEIEEAGEAGEAQDGSGESRETRKDRDYSKPPAPEPEET